MFVPTYHLRRVNPKAHHPEELILLGEVTKFGRNADNVDVVLTSAVYSNMISRDHAIITGRIDPNSRKIVDYKIRDNSLNGTYIDDKRVKDEMLIRDSAVIKFGHMNGAAIKAGIDAPQANAEFSFVFEKCNSTNRRYIGWEGLERRKTVVCTGDGKSMAETGEDHRTRRKPPAKEPVSSTTAPITISTPFPMQHNQAKHGPPPHPPHASTHPSPLIHPTPTSLFNPTSGLPLAQDAGASFYHILSQQKPAFFGGMPGHPFPSPIFQQQHLPFPAGFRPNGQFAGVAPTVQQRPHVITPMDGNPSSRTAPIRSPPVECDSSVPSPPKTGTEATTGNADSSSQQSPRRAKDDDEDSFSVPDSPPRAPRPHDIAGRSVTNSPAPPSPRPVEKVETPKEEKKKELKLKTPKKPVSPKKPVHPGKSPKTGGSAEKKSHKELDRLLTDLTEGSFAMQATRRGEGTGVGSERRKMITQGKMSPKKAVSKNKLHRQLSSASSDEDSDDEEEASGVPVRSSTVSRPSMVGKKASTSTPKVMMKKNRGTSARRKEESEESDPYEETDEESEGEMKNGKRKIPKKSSLREKKEKITPKGNPKKKPGRKKKKDSDESSEPESDEDDDDDEPKKKEKEKKGDEDEYWDTEQTKCDLNKCRMPKEADVHWVQCDECSLWFHIFCLFGENTPYKGKTFRCGCPKKIVHAPPTKKKKK